jgi:tRNA 2-thiouridine synthesizing protein A
MSKFIDKTLDTSGLLCPEPVMMLHKAVREIQGGQVIEVIATDPSTTRDIPKFCNFLGHELLSHEAVGNTWVYRIQKKAD